MPVLSAGTARCNATPSEPTKAGNVGADFGVVREGSRPHSQSVQGVKMHISSEDIRQWPQTLRSRSGNQCCWFHCRRVSRGSLLEVTKDFCFLFPRDFFEIGSGAYRQGSPGGGGRSKSESPCPLSHGGKRRFVGFQCQGLSRRQVRSHVKKPTTNPAVRRGPLPH
jgi:hypothetical protein